MKTGFRRFLRIAVLTVASAAPATAKACAVCMGASDTPVASAMNSAIFLMLGLVGLMLFSAGGLIFYLARRARVAQPAGVIHSNGREVNHHA